MAFVQNGCACRRMLICILVSSIVQRTGMKITCRCACGLICGIFRQPSTPEKYPPYQPVNPFLCAVVYHYSDSSRNITPSCMSVLYILSQNLTKQMAMKGDGRYMYTVFHDTLSTPELLVSLVLCLASTTVTLLLLVFLILLSVYFSVFKTMLLVSFSGPCCTLLFPFFKISQQKVKVHLCLNGSTPNLPVQLTSFTNTPPHFL